MYLKWYPISIKTRQSKYLVEHQIEPMKVNSNLMHKLYNLLRVQVVLPMSKNHNIYRDQLGKFSYQLRQHCCSLNHLLHLEK